MEYVVCFFDSRGYTEMIFGDVTPAMQFLEALRSQDHVITKPLDVRLAVHKWAD